ncbi:MAG TPA: CDP-diacylglycerol--serine O-phosphatidyltransferase [Bacteroidales bacterium]|nr:CDP-diacylglycerol--serine O-phosphatidyltransferase [Bacteroidales bacterium]HRT90692.1 CDP-diacylglycerol--serine O-phosphatidyltransferase [Bacteroidales bacterium]
MRHIPNGITSLNLASGFTAIILILSGNIPAACWMIAAAMVFDFLDGFASRLLKAYSDMGKELDSLADVVSFGAAPGLLVYTLLSGRQPLPGNLHFLIISACFAVCAGLRLARFNIDTEQTVNFRGLPTPAAAFAVITLAFAGEYAGSDFITSLAVNKITLSVYTLVISALMVSRIPMVSLKIKHLRLAGNEARYLLLLSSAILIVFAGPAGAVLIIPAYIIISVISSFVGWL